MIALVRAVLSVVVRQPNLLPIALVVGRGLVPTKWWRRWPPVPFPDRGWIAFRLETAYGDPNARPSVEDVKGYLEWAREMRSLRHASRLR